MRGEPRGARTPLPARYGEDRIVLQARDPWYLHVYWELRSETVERGKRALGAQDAFFALRVHELESGWFDVSVSGDLGDWYLHVTPDRGWFVEIGLKTSDGRFYSLARSNTVRTPPDKPSDRIDERWGLLKELGGVRLDISSSFAHS